MKLLFRVFIVFLVIWLLGSIEHALGFESAAIRKFSAGVTLTEPYQEPDIIVSTITESGQIIAPEEPFYEGAN